MNLETSEKFLKERYCKKKELDDFPEDAGEGLKEETDAAAENKTAIQSHFAEFAARCKIEDFSTDNSLETTTK